ncbi:MAG: DUF4160 domain-containing protein [Firmicutes bacterium]|jgi:hypothetical protein|nr:DUF4160 domain-containing protein [Bacillota bacterium]
MHWQDDPPPHFHATFGEDEALMDILQAVVLRGRLPSSWLKLLLVWAEIHRDESLDTWQRAQNHEELLSIDPLR